MEKTKREIFTKEKKGARTKKRDRLAPTHNKGCEEGVL
jgi:hypothetical protein